MTKFFIKQLAGRAGIGFRLSSVFVCSCDCTRFPLEWTNQTEPKRSFGFKQQQLQKTVKTHTFYRHTKKGNKLVCFRAVTCTSLVKNRTAPCRVQLPTAIQNPDGVVCVLVVKRDAPAVLYITMHHGKKNTISFVYWEVFNALLLTCRSKPRSLTDHCW